MNKPELRVDGVLYVPVSEANPTVKAIEDALVGQWGGANWRTAYPDAPSYLRVVVSDTFDEDEGATIEEFVGRILQGLE